MKPEKLRELSDEELRTQDREFSEQVFRLRFQMATGQTEGLQRLRFLKKDLARIKTILRERQLESVAPQGE